jgi:hypothetical protein
MGDHLTPYLLVYLLVMFVSRRVPAFYSGMPFRAYAIHSPPADSRGAAVVGTNDGAKAWIVA